MDAIVFQPLTGASPYTEGDGSASLPALRSFGHEQANTGSGILPRLRSVGTGVLTVAVLGVGSASLSPLSAFGMEAAGGWGRASLAPLSSAGAPTDELEAPQDGSGSGTLSLLYSEGEGTYVVHATGTGSGALPALGAFGMQPAVGGGYGAATLPLMRSSGIDYTTAPTSAITAVASWPVASIVGNNTLHVTESFAMHGAPTATAVTVLLAHLRTTGALQPSVGFTTSLHDGIDYHDALAVIWQVTAASGINFISDAAATPNNVVALLETVHAIGAAKTHTEARELVATVIAINELVATGWKMDATDSVALQAALADAVTRAVSVLDQAVLATSTAPSLRLLAITDESVQLAAQPLGTLDMLASLEDGVLLYTVLRLGDSEYVGWVLNQGAASEYRNYPFNGFAEAGGRYWGTADDGLYLLEGTTDDGDPIDAHIKTALMDFGSSVLNRCPDVYVSMATGNQVVLKVVSTGRDGTQREDIYTASVRPGEVLHNNRIKVGAGLTSTYWQWELANVDGGAFELDELSFRPLALSRRI